MDFGGGHGTLRHFDGTEMTAQNTGIENPIFDLVGAPDGRLLAAALHLYARTDSTWKEETGNQFFNRLANVEGKLYGLMGSLVARYENAAWHSVESSGVTWLGGSATGRVLVIEWDADIAFLGTEWHTVLQTARAQFVGIQGRSADDVYAVGEEGMIIHFDGSAWRAEQTGTERTFGDIWISDSGRLYAVGRGVAAVKADGVWTVEDIEPYITLYAVWGAGDGDVFATGSEGRIYHHDGTTWESMSCPTEHDLPDVWGSGPNDVYAVSRERPGQAGEGDILHYDGEAWSVQYSDPANHLYRIWGTGRGEVLALGDDFIYRYDGAAWRSEPVSWGNDIVDFHGRSLDDLYACGFRGSFWHYDGATWTSIEPHLPDLIFRRLWCAPDGQVFVIEASGGILRYGP